MLCATQAQTQTKPKPERTVLFLIKYMEWNVLFSKINACKRVVVIAKHANELYSKLNVIEKSTHHGEGAVMHCVL